MIFWNLGLVDTFSVLKLCVNCGSQYMGVVLSSAAGNSSNLGVRSLLEPILGLGTSYQFVQGWETPTNSHFSFLLSSFRRSSSNWSYNQCSSKIGYTKAILLFTNRAPSLKDFAIIADSIVSSTIYCQQSTTSFRSIQLVVIFNNPYKNLKRWRLLI